MYSMIVLGYDIPGNHTFEMEEQAEAVVLDLELGYQ